MSPSLTILTADAFECRLENFSWEIYELKMRCKSSANLTLKHKKGLWSPDEDQKLRDYILNHDLGCWSSVPINAGLQRSGKSCRLRWTNYLRPGLKRGMFTTHEEQVILTLHGMLGNNRKQQ
ncbi:hypothetical protein L6452_05163 [Arctium lappa]|uniref:Uncharacterized protein n=1 Tax=Arctium lappa TaxID=4217 RepID=A0ACB9EFT2_ARCLA|nr:hypothetical protein L6452_05163 [Arctium lappa]